MITVTARLRITPERTGEALAMFSAVTSPTTAEPGCDFYEFYRHVDDPTTFMSVQRWTDIGALLWHAEETEQGRRVARELPALVSEPADIRVHLGARVLAWPLDAETKATLR
jgi:quinol monooxygenase YgiN